MQRVAFVLGVLVTSCGCAFALDPSLDISQYAHKAWTVRDGFSLGNIYAMAQTPDGYLWFGTEFGLFRFDGVRTVPWQPPPGQQLPEKNINALLVTRDGTLWIGTFAGLATWNRGKLTRRPEIGTQFVSSLFEDREGTVWVGTLETPGRLCAIRSSGLQCYGEHGAFGRAVWALYEDSSGNLWAGAQSGLWRMKPGAPKRYATPAEVIGLSNTDDGRLLIALHGAGLLQIAGGKLEPHPVQGASSPNRQLRDRDINSNRLLRDRDGALWIGTVERGLIHVHDGRTDVFTKSDGLSGDVILSVFEDREHTVWVASTGGLDRFREFPVATFSVKQGLSSDATHAVLAATDGSIWIGAHEGLTRWNHGQTTIFGKASGLPDDAPESLFQDDRERIWVSTRHGLAYFKDGRFIAVNTVRGGEVHFITGDNSGNLWLAEHQSLLHLLDGRLVEQIPWSELGRLQTAGVLLSDRGGVWLGFWYSGGLAYFKDHRLRTSYKTAEGLGDNNIIGLQLGPDGALWAATQRGGLSRLKDGRVLATLTSRNGLPCDTINWSIETDDRSFWLYTGCGLVRIARTELDAWVADPSRMVETTVWDAADGVRLRSSAASAYGPRVTKATDGKLWFVTGEGVQLVDPLHLTVNKVPPPVHIEQVVADGKPYQLKQGMHLPANVRDVSIDYTALSLAAPEKVHFKYMLEGQDLDWKEIINIRQVHYSNLHPRQYRFRIMACNHSGVWNATGDTLEFSIEPRYYQTAWFSTTCVAAFLALLWAGYRFRIGQLQRVSKRLRDVIETIPAMAWTALPDGLNEFVNRRWAEYTGLSAEETAGSGWTAAVHPDERQPYGEKWRASLATGEPFEFEARFRCAANGEYRWFLGRGVPLRDRHGEILRWYGVLTDIEDRKRAEQEHERLHQLEADLAHINRVNMMGELAASIAHEVNQPLSGIVSNGGACLRWLAGDPPNVEEVREAVRDMVRDGERAGQVIARIRALTRNAEPPKERLDLNETVREVLTIVGDEAKRKSVLIQTRFADDVLPVLGDRVQLQQVVLNLVMNAIEAMRSVGERTRDLMITTRNIAPDQVQVTVQDSGVGLAPDTVARIFEPFYTTKAGGMGMGLSISRSILQSHGGRLWATGRNGPGTSFHFTLPKHQEDGSVATVASV